MAVNWTPIRHTRQKSGKPYSEWRFEAVCDLCGHERLLKKCDAKRTEQGGSICGLCQRRQAGAKGYAKTKAKYGEAFGAKLIQSYRLNHPSSLELQVMSHLESLNVSYQREVIVCDRWLVDFVVDGFLVIEVDGEYIHSLRDPNNEAMRRNQIEECGYPLLHLREADMPQSRSLIALFILEVRHASSSVYAN